MKTKQSNRNKLAMALFIVNCSLFIFFIACDEENTHTHEWEWKVTTPATPTADGLETETCKTCGATRGTKPIAKLELETKTFPITLKDGALVFTVEYKAYPTDAEPAYLAYIEERLETFVASTVSVNVDAVNLLLTKGNSFKITIEYAEPTYTGMSWDTSLQSFKIHNDWISTASGVTDLTLGTMRDAFNSVVIDPTHREFTIILEGFEDHPITVIDTRTGSNDTDLETLGVIARLTAGLSAQAVEDIARAVGYGLVIEAEETTDYTRFQARSGNRMGANIAYVLSDDVNFAGRMATPFSQMLSMEPDEGGE